MQLILKCVILAKLLKGGTNHSNTSRQICGEVLKAVVAGYIPLNQSNELRVRTVVYRFECKNKSLYALQEYLVHKTKNLK